jgi:phosphatidylinositol alpha-1,6-mannosyltransferase
MTAILILTQNFPPDLGGIQSLMAGLACEAARQRYSVMIMADTFEGGTAHDAAFGAEVVRYGGIKPFRRMLKARAACRIIKERASEAVFCDSWRSLEHLTQSNVPIAVFAHGTEFPHRPNPRKAARLTRTFAKASVIIPVSKYASALAKPYTGTTRLVVINPPIAPLQSASEAAATLRARYGDPILVGLARLEPRKGFDRVIEALPEVAKLHPGVAFLIGGEGSDKHRLKDIAERHGVAGRVHFFGSVAGERKAALLSAADLFTMPTRRVGNSVEGFGIVYAEAAWYGVPSVAGTESGAGDFVDDGVNGRLVDGARSIAHALTDLLSDHARLIAMGKAAQAKVRSSGMWEQAFEHLMTVVLG